MISYLIVNFGGPRTLQEVEPFLAALLTDKDVVRTRLPQSFHNLLFRKIARKRAQVIAHDYSSIGGKSPIYEDTEYIAETLREKLAAPVMTFHRYLPATHAASLEAISRHSSREIRVFPMFPQFTFATTGSIARYFADHLSTETINKMRWVKSYPSHPAFVRVTQQMIRTFLEEHQLSVEETILLFSAHGLPRTFIEEGDLYEYECNFSFSKVMEAFPQALGRLSYQSKFGPGEWLRPYTEEVCEEIKLWYEDRKHVVFVPISFTSDHIETLFEVEQQYMPLIRKHGLEAYRLPAFNRSPEWIDAIVSILQDFTPVSTDMLVRKG